MSSKNASAQTKYFFRERFNSKLRGRLIMKVQTEVNKKVSTWDDCETYS